MDLVIQFRKRSFLDVCGPAFVFSSLRKDSSVIVGTCIFSQILVSCLLLFFFQSQSIQYSIVQLASL